MGGGFWNLGRGEAPAKGTGGENCGLKRNRGRLRRGPRAVGHKAQGSVPGILASPRTWTNARKTAA